MQGKIKFELVETYFFDQLPCHICDGQTKKVGVLTEVKDGEYAGLQVCEKCLKNGDFDSILNATINRLQSRAEFLRELIGRIVAPTYDEWEKEAERVHKEIVAIENVKTTNICKG